MAAFDAKCVVQLVQDGYSAHELSFCDGPQMRAGNERLGRPVGVRQLPCHERGEVPLDGLEVDSEVPRKAFVPKAKESTQEALTIRLRGRNQLDSHSIRALTFVGAIVGAGDLVRQ